MLKLRQAHSSEAASASSLQPRTAPDAMQVAAAAVTNTDVGPVSHEAGSTAAAEALDLRKASSKGAFLAQSLAETDVVSCALPCPALPCPALPCPCPASALHLTSPALFLTSPTLLCTVMYCRTGATASSSIVDQAMAQHAQHIQQSRQHAVSSLPVSLARLLPDSPGEPIRCGTLRLTVKTTQC